MNQWSTRTTSSPLAAEQQHATHKTPFRYVRGLLRQRYCNLFETQINSILYYQSVTANATLHSMPSLGDEIRLEATGIETKCSSSGRERWESLWGTLRCEELRQAIRRPRSYSHRSKASSDPAANHTRRWSNLPVDSPVNRRRRAGNGRHAWHPRDTQWSQLASQLTRRSTTSQSTLTKAPDQLIIERRVYNVPVKVLEAICCCCYRDRQLVLLATCVNPLVKEWYCVDCVHMYKDTPYFSLLPFFSLL